jgi:MFS transporter, FHS family, L-fucose permease
LFFRTPLPEIRESEITSSTALDRKPLINHTNFTGGVIAQFFYVAAQVGIAALFINYCTEGGNEITNSEAALLLGYSLILFTVGRFVGTALMRFVAPNRLLAMYAVVNVMLCLVVVFMNGLLPVYCLMALFFFQSIMFPTIFALAVKDVGHHTKKASSFLIMSIVGGAIVPYVMGLVADSYSTALAYLIPMVCFVVVAWYGVKGYRVRS